MKKLHINLMVVVVMTILWSCGPKVTTIKNTENDLSAYNTYAYLPNTNFEKPDYNAIPTENLTPAVIDAMNNNMQKAGYTLDRENPDLLVLLSSDIDPKYDATVSPVFASYPYTTPYPISPYYQAYYYWGYDDIGDIIGYSVDVDRRKEGSLAVNLIDRKTRQVVWSGTAKDKIYDIDTTVEVAEYVDAIFAEYPTISQ